MKRKLLSFFLALCMVVGLVPTVAFSAFADGAATGNTVPDGYKAVYYMADGGTGDGKSYDSPAGSAQAVVTAINADGYTTGDEVLVYMIPSVKIGDTLTQSVAESMVSLNHTVHHDARITYTTYQYNASTANYAVLAMVAQYAQNSLNVGVRPQGPTVFKDIAILDTWIDYRSDCNAQGYDFTYDNVKVCHMNDSHQVAACVQTALYAGYNRGGHGTVGAGGRLSIDDGALFSLLSFGGYHDANNTQTIANDMTIEINDTTLSKLALASTNGKMHYRKNLNLVLNNATVTSFISQNGSGQSSVVDGAVQILLNGTSAVTNCNPTTAAVGSDGESEVPVYILKAGDGVTLDVTDTAGEYTFTSTSGKVWAKDSNRNVTVSADGKLTLTEAGTYTVTATEPSEYDAEYFIKDGATGDGRSFSTPAGSAKTVVQSINADGYTTGNNVLVNVIPSTTLEINETPSKEKILGIAELYHEVHHDADITYTTYGYDPEEKNYAILATASQYPDYVNGSSVFFGTTHTKMLFSQGNEAFKNIILLETNAYGHSVYQAQGYNVSFDNTPVYWVRYYNNEYVQDDVPFVQYKNKSTMYTVTNRTGHGTLGQGGRVSVDNSGMFSKLVYGSYTDAASNPETFENDHTFVVNNTSIDTVLLTETASSRTMTYKKNINLILNGSTVGKFNAVTNDTYAPAVVHGAVQVLMNNNSSVGTMIDMTKVKSSSGEDDVPLYVLKGGKNVMLDVTETAGVYTVDGDVDVLATDAAGKQFRSKDGVLTLPAAGTYNVVAMTVATYYVTHGGLGTKTGLDAENAMASTADAIAAIEQGDCYSGEVVILNNPDYADEYIVTNATETKYTYWTKPAAHQKSIVVRGADGQNSVLATQKNVNTGDIVINGPTTFTDITLLRLRSLDEGIMSGGQDLTLTDSVILKGTANDTYHANQSPVWYFSNANTSEQYGTYVKFGSGRQANTGNGGTLTLNIPKSLYVFADSNSAASSYTEDMTLKVDNGNNSFRIVWSSAGNVTYGKNLNLVLGNVSEFIQAHLDATKDPIAKAHTVTINGALQVIRKATTAYAVPENFTVNGGFYDVVVDQAGLLDVTDTAGVYSVGGDKVAYVQSEDNKTVYYGDETLTLPTAGDYTVHFADSIDAMKEAITTPSDIQAGYEFKGWNDDGKGTLTANIVLVAYPYYLSNSGSDENDGLTEKTPVKTFEKAVELATALRGYPYIAFVLLDDMTLPSDLPGFNKTVFLKSQNGAKLSGENDEIALFAMINMDIDLAAGQTILMNGYDLTLNGAVDRNNPVDIKNCKRDDGSNKVPTVTINGKYVHHLYTATAGKSNGSISIKVNGGTLDTLIVGSDDPTYNKLEGSITVDVLSGKFLQTKAGSPLNFKAETGKTSNFYVAMNADLYNFGGTTQTTLDGQTLSHFTDYTTEVTDQSENLPNVMFTDRRMVYSADTENVIIALSNDKFAYSGDKTPYHISQNGLNVFYGKDGVIKCTASITELSWTKTFSADDMPIPTLDTGYEFGGWDDDGNGTLTAKVIQPNFAYVSADGADTNNGTQAAPFATIDKAIKFLDDGGNTAGTIYVVGELIHKGLDSETSTVVPKEHIELSVGRNLKRITLCGVGDNARIVLTPDEEYGTVNINSIGSVTIRNLTIDCGNAVALSVTATGYMEICDDVAIENTSMIVVSQTAYTDDEDGPGAATLVLPKLQNLSVNIALVGFENAANTVTVVLNGTKVAQLLNMSQSSYFDYNIIGYDGATIEGYMDYSEVLGTPVVYNSINIALNGTDATFPAALEGDPKINCIANNDPNTVVVPAKSEHDGKIHFAVQTVKNGKYPIAVSTNDNGTIVVGDTYDSIPDSLNYTWYEQNTYGDYINYRKSLANTYKRLTEDKELNVVYYGGSVTNGYGASNSDTKSWRALIGQWLVDSFPDATIRNINRASGESGTRLGVHRLKQAVINQNPDLLFFEYTINDNYDVYQHANGSLTEAGKAAIQSQCETILREVKEALPNCDIVMVIVTDSGKLSDNRNKTGIEKLHAEGKIHEELAIHYNVPSVWVGPALANNLQGTTYAEWQADWKNYATDSVHLNDAGNYEYYKVLHEYLYNELFCTDYSAREAFRDDLPATKYRLVDGNRTEVTPTAALIATSESLGGSGYSYVGGVNLYDFTGAAVSSGSDSVYAFQFNGTDVSLYSNYYSANGSNAIMVSVDGGEYTRVNTIGHAPSPIVTGLASGEHTVRIKEAPGMTARLRIQVLFTHDSTKDTPASTAFGGYSDGAQYTLKPNGGCYRLDSAATIDEAVGKFPDHLVVVQAYMNEQPVTSETTDRALVPNAAIRTAVASAKDYFDFLGVQIRMPKENVAQGLRFVVEKPKDSPSSPYSYNHTFGMVVIPSAFIGDDRTYTDYDSSVVNSTTDVVGGDKLYIGSTHTVGDKTYASANVAGDKVYKQTATTQQYTTCLINIPDTNYGTYYTLRPYVRYISNVDGQWHLAYGDAFRSNVYEVAKAISNESGASEAEKALAQEIISAVEGNN